MQLQQHNRKYYMNWW